jgi:GNAT superfamily N-acetyltransferase
MRYVFTLEDLEPNAVLQAGYEEECRAFVLDAIKGGRWHVWVAEEDDEIVSHLFVALVDKVPRPVQEKRRIAYMTNVYTRPSHRGRGIGGELLRRAQEAARDADVELIIVWPSDESVSFYQRHGFNRPVEPLIWPAD